MGRLAKGLLLACSLPGLVGAQDLMNHITLKYSAPRYAMWTVDPHLVSPAWEANPAGVFQVPFAKVGASFAMAEFREGTGDLKAPAGSGVLEGRTVASNISVMEPAMLENITAAMNFESFGVSFGYLGDEIFGVEYYFEDSRVELGRFTACVDDTLTAADVEGLDTWLPVTWNLEGTGYARITGQGDGSFAARPLCLGLGFDLGWTRAGLGFTLTRYTGALDFTIQALGDTFSQRPEMDIHRDSVVWEGDLYGRMVLDSILFWRQEMAVEETWAYSIAGGLQREAGPWRFGVLYSFTPGFVLRGSASDSRYFVTWLDTAITDVGIDPDYSYLYAYTRHDTLRIDGNAWLNFVPDHDLGSSGYDDKAWEVPVPTRGFLAGGLAREGESWVFDAAGGGDLFPWGQHNARELYGAFSLGYAFSSWLIRAGALYRLKEYDVPDEQYITQNGFLGLTVNMRSGPVIYGLGLRTGLPEYMFSIAERAQGVLASGIKTRTTYIPATLTFSIYLIPEEW